MWTVSLSQKQRAAVDKWEEFFQQLRQEWLGELGQGLSQLLGLPASVVQLVAKTV